MPRRKIAVAKTKIRSKVSGGRTVRTVAKHYEMTPARKAALRKAQLASAAARRGQGNGHGMAATAHHSAAVTAFHNTALHAPDAKTAAHKSAPTAAHKSAPIKTKSAAAQRVKSAKRRRRAKVAGAVVAAGVGTVASVAAAKKHQTNQRKNRAAAMARHPAFANRAPRLASTNAAPKASKRVAKKATKARSKLRAKNATHRLRKR